MTVGTSGNCGERAAPVTASLVFGGVLFILSVAIPVGIFVLLAAFASAGWGLGLFFFYLFAVMLHAYAVDDRVVPPREDEGEEY